MKNPIIHWFNIAILCIGLFFAATLAGCMSLPHVSAPPLPPGSAASATNTSPANSVGEAVHREVVLFWIVGIALIAGAGVLVYFQFYIPAIKVFIAGVVLPIVGTWFSQHYALVIAATLVGLALWYILTHQAAVSALIQEAGPDVDLVLDKIKNTTSAVAAKTGAVIPPSPALPSTSTPIK